MVIHDRWKSHLRDVLGVSSIHMVKLKQIYTTLRYIDIYIYISTCVALFVWGALLNIGTIYKFAGSIYKLAGSIYKFAGSIYKLLGSDHEIVRYMLSNSKGITVLNGIWMVSFLTGVQCCNVRGIYWGHARCNKMLFKHELLVGVPVERTNWNLLQKPNSQQTSQ